jgi:hypothetical protein
MIKTKTVLVLGAGASVPYGLPSGLALKDKICVQLDALPDTLMNQSTDPTILQEFRETLADAGRTSVDAFLETRPEFAEIGRLAIALVLLPCERTDTLITNWPGWRLDNATSMRGGHWYELVFNMLTIGRKFEDIDLTNLSVVTFNYDRSLEHYFFTALLNAYGRSLEETAAKLSVMQIVHVHGSLGQLPWQPAEDALAVPYGDSSPATFLLARNSIKVLHEAQDDSAEFQQARSLITRAQKVYFLGFGFHRVNLRRLGAERIGPSGYFGGTAVDLSYDTRMHVARLPFFKSFPNLNPPRFHDKDIYRFLYEHVSFDD